MSEGWEGMQRQGQDMADRFRHGLSCMLHNSSWSFNSPRLPQEEAEEDRDEEEEEGGGFALWLWPQKPCSPPRNKPSRVQLRRGSGSGSSKRRKPCVDLDFDLDCNGSLLPGRSASAIGGICDLGQRLGQAGVALVQHLVQSIPLPFHTIGAGRPSPEENPSSVRVDGWSEAEEMGIPERKHVGIGWKSYVSGGAASFPRSPTPQNESDTHEEDFSPPTANEDIFPFPSKPPWHFHNQGSISVSTNYDSRTQEVESSVVARGDLWRAEASHGGNASTNGASPLFLFQIGPILFVRDTTLLLPVHLSKQHLLWYGFDRKNGLHSLCPAVWSKHRRWLFMSMICLNPLTCSFIDLQFPNGQFTYVAGEGLNSSAFFPVLGGLLQAQSRHPGDTKLSFSRKTKWGMRFTPALQLSDKSFSLGVMQPLAWQRSGLIVRPSVQVSVTPTFGGRNSGWRAELIHSPKEKLSWSCGCSMSIQPSAFASVSIGRSKKYGQSGSLGLVLQVETPLENLSRASFSVQLNSGVEF